MLGGSLVYFSCLNVVGWTEKFEVGNMFFTEHFICSVKKMFPTSITRPPYASLLGGMNLLAVHSMANVTSILLLLSAKNNDIFKHFQAAFTRTRRHL